MSDLIEPEPVRGDRVKLRSGPIVPSPFTPLYADVVQGAIAACPIAAVMVALARARPTKLRQILGSPLKGPVLSKRRDDEIYNLWADQYYAVRFELHQQPIDITPYVYFDEQEVQYAKTPGGAGWPSYIEKAYAVWKSKGGQGGSGGDYTRLAKGMSLGGPPTLTEVMLDVIGPTEILDLAPGRDLFFDASGNSRAASTTEIERMATQAASRPTVAPTNTVGAEQVHSDLVDDHGFAILGFDARAKLIRLRNPWGSNGSKNPEPRVTVSQYRRAFQGIWQAV